MTKLSELYSSRLKKQKPLLSKRTQRELMNPSLVSPKKVFWNIYAVALLSIVLGISVLVIVVGFLLLDWIMIIIGVIVLITCILLFVLLSSRLW